MKKLSVLGFIGILLFLFSCQKEDAESNRLLNVVFPDYFPAPAYDFGANPPTEQGFELGKKLFYDANLSADATVSCGSCHQQFAGFANLDHETSHGVDNCFGKRNAPVLFNLIWKDNLLLDGGIKNLELVPLNAIADTCEMATSLSAVMEYLNGNSTYKRQFKQAFGTSEITSQKMLFALAQFTGMMISDDSKYDQVKQGKTTFTEEEQKGYQLFKTNCGQCHTEPLFTDNSFRNNGLDIISSDNGRAHITELITDEGKFKVPTLRNIEVSRPYMHDGRLSTLNEVLEHYSTGIKNHSNLDPILKNGISLNSEEKISLLAFLKTLTDQTFLKNPKFSEE